MEPINLNNKKKMKNALFIVSFNIINWKDWIYSIYTRWKFAGFSL